MDHIFKYKHKTTKALEENTGENFGDLWLVENS